MESFYNEDKSKIFSYINLNLINFKIENELNLKNKKNRQIDLIFNKLKELLNMKLKIVI